MSTTASSSCADPILAAHAKGKRRPTTAPEPSRPQQINADLRRIERICRKQTELAGRAKRLCLDEMAVGVRDCSSCEVGYQRIRIVAEQTAWITPCPRLGIGMCREWRSREERYLRRLGFGVRHLAVQVDRIRQEENRALVREYAAGIDRALDTGAQMFIHGLEGRGKTSALAIIARAAHPRKSVALTTGPAMMDFDFWRGSTRVNELHRCRLLLIDDLQLSEQHPKIVASLHNLADERWKHQRATVLTTNVSPSEAKRGPYRYLVDRWTDADRTYVVAMTGKSWRQ